MRQRLNQTGTCLLFLLLACNNKPKAHWDCEQPLPGEFKIVQSKGGNYAIQSGWAREGVSDYSEKKPRYKYSYYYLAENENGWIVEVAVGMEKQFDDSCEAKQYYALYEKQQKVLHDRAKKV